MRLLIIVTLFVFTGFQQKADPLESALDSLVPSLLIEKNVPGVSLAVIKNGEIILAKGYGKADIKTNKDVKAQTHFNIGSISKSLTAWAVVDLSEKGRINLDSPVMKYIRKWKFPESKYDLNKLTIRRVLSHTGGLSVRGYNGQFVPGDKLPTLEESLSGYSGSDGSLDFITEPGTEFRYSSGGYTLLQLLIEEVTQKSFATFMKETVFDPLKMRETGYMLTGSTATPYKPNKSPWPHYQFVEQGSGGIYTTASDLAKFIVVFSKKKMLIQPAVETGGVYGLGCKMAPVSEKTKLISHDGANEGWRALYLMQPETTSGIVILTNSDDGGKVGAPIICKTFSIIGIDMFPLCENGVPKQR